MLDREINFDRFVRGLIFLLVFTGAIWVIAQISSVLLPFVVAMVLAYLLYPVVNFLQVRCHLHSRVLCVVLTLLIIIGIIVGLAMLAIPSIHSEWLHLKDIALDYIEGRRQVTGMAAEVQHFIVKQSRHLRLDQFLRSDDLIETIKEALPQVWGMLWSTANILISIGSSIFALSYLFLLLSDYERYAEGWIKFVPESKRHFAQQLIDDIQDGMSGYFRGQALVALGNCIMFSVGFWLIGLPLPFLLGIGIGLISFIPYIQVVGFIPAFFLALLHSIDTGESFWMLMGGVVLVYAVIQVIQDVFLTPRIMGKIIGLPGAIVLLALTAWGYVLGIIGLIIALPATTLCISYYKRYVVCDDYETSLDQANAEMPSESN